MAKAIINVLVLQLENQWPESTQAEFVDKTKYPAVALKSSKWVTVFDRREGTK